MMPLPMMSKPSTKTDDALLGSVYVAKPCPAEWANMEGDDHSRFCGSCKKNVYNLSAMTASEAANLIREKEGKLCIRYYQRADGTIITQDCPVGVAAFQRKVRRAFAASVVGFASVLLMFTETMRFATDKPSLFAERFHYWAERLHPTQEPPVTKPSIGDPPTRTVGVAIGGAMAVRAVDPPAEVRGKVMVLGEMAPAQPAKRIIQGQPTFEPTTEVRGRVISKAHK